MSTNNRTTVAEALAARQSLENIFIQGWIRTKRDSKGFSFLEINDGSCLKNLQVIVDQKVPGYKQVQELGTGASVSVSGRHVESPGKGQNWELQADRVEVLGAADPETYPLQKKRHSDEFLRSIAQLRPRTNKYGAMARIRSELSFAFHHYFHEHGYYYIHSPVLTGLDCEGAGELFRVTCLDPDQYSADPQVMAEDFFGQPAYLTVSGQLTAEVMACSLGKVYTFGPTFRAENSNTPRHAAEFWMIEPEVAFADLGDIIDLAEDLIKSVIAGVRKNRQEDLDLFARFVDKELNRNLDNVLDNEFVRLPYEEAVAVLKEVRGKKKFEYPVDLGTDLQTEHERYLVEEHFQKPVVVYDYPTQIKPFYMRVNERGNTVAAMDVLLPRVGEVVGGSQREERLEVLQERMQDLGMRVEDYSWYLDLRRFGTVPHSGFGLGFERLLMFLTGVHNIRDVLPFPRTPKHLQF
ncbi:MAG: asparagine--tRNA ligase [Desulfohalobiaceae bacterium]|nr:asparagine--tRNA ligase [Desulfohalobiaceae bacterium]